MNVRELIQNMTLEEKAGYLCGCTNMGTMPIPRLSIPALKFSDGPHGVRALKEGGDSMSGISNSLPSTSFPTAATAANSWNPDNLRRMGQALGEECLNYGIHVLLGPAVNIKRNPLAGRNFEYFSEDPLIAGELGAAFTEGVQSTGVGTAVKHFAANNAENFRFTGNSVIDERALREIYLKGFERIVKKSHPFSMMCAYNQINGEFCAQNKWLLTDVLRQEWGFDGVVMTDWGAVKERVKGVKAGLDLEMPGMEPHNVRSVIRAVQSGSLSEEAVDTAVSNMLALIRRVSRQKNASCDFQAHAGLAAEIAADSAVLLKNDGILPLSRDQKYLIIGDLFHYMRYQGSGSSLINPQILQTPEAEFTARGVDYSYVRGYRESETGLEPEYLAQALREAEHADYILVFAGQTDYVESEGFDRESMSLPENQLVLLTELAKLGRKAVLVLFGGSSIELPFADGFNAVLNLFLPGECGGTAAYQLLFGEKNPSGKLAETWAERYEDVPFGSLFSKNPVEAYRESVYVGYRYYLSAGKRVRYPFGFGLSYTEFTYSDLKLDTQDGEYTAGLNVSNTGRFDGAEVVQLYVSAPESGVFKPLRELRGFSKVFVAAGRTEHVTVRFSQDDLRYYHPGLKKWVLEPGTYRIQIGASCEDIRLETELKITGETVPSPYSEAVLAAYGNAAGLPEISDHVFSSLIGRSIPVYEMGKRPYTMETTLGEFDTLFGAVIKKAIVNVGVKQYKKACKMPDGPEKEREKKAGLFISKMMPSNSLRSLCYSSAGGLKYPVAKGMLEIANGHILRGIRAMLGK